MTAVIGQDGVGVKPVSLMLKLALHELIFSRANGAMEENF